MAATEVKRLFIGGLVRGVTEEELVEKFSRFGEVSNVEIKTRANETDSKTFAYLNLTAADTAFKKCFTAYNNTKWKGGQLKLQFAKESFLSKLKKEQAEAKMSQEKKEGKPASVHKSFALEPGKKAVPGTPLDDKGTWVVGKYGRVQPVLHLRKPGSRKMVTLDPSKMTHCLKKLKSDDFDVQKPSELTWQLEENTSDINKRRQGQFPALEAPRYQSTPKEQSGLQQESIFSRLQGLAAEEQVSDTEMEVVPLQKLDTVSKIHAQSGYDSDDSAGSADTDEIVSKASGKKASKLTATNFSTASVKKGNRVKSPVKGHAQSDEDSTCSSNFDTSCHKTRGKKTQESLYNRKEPLVKSCKPDLKVSDTEEKQRLQFQFVKTPKLKGKALKKSVKLSGSKTASAENMFASEGNENRDGEMKVPMTNSKGKSNKTPEFKGLGMLSSDSEDDIAPSGSTESGSSKGQSCPKEPTIAVKSAKTVTSVLEQKRRQNHVSSDSEGTDDILSNSKRQTSEKKQDNVSAKKLKLHSKNAPSEDAQQLKDFGRLSGDNENLVPSHRSMKEKYNGASGSSEEYRKTSAKDAKLFAHTQVQKKQPKKMVHNSEGAGNCLHSVKTKTAASVVKGSGPVSQLVAQDIDEFGNGLVTDSSFPAQQKKQKRSKPVSSDDSDLDDNDFEKVGKKLAARALQQEQKGQWTGSKGHQQTAPATSASVTSVGNTNMTRKRKTSQGEEGHLTSMQKSHQAYSKIQQEKKKKENLVTKALREGTGSKHITFSDSEDEKFLPEKPAQMSLFSDSDADSDSASEVDFSIRPQFEGSKGKKLFELQSKIMDKRFRFDERFETDSEGSEHEEITEQDSEDEMAKEKQRNLQILEKVLGYKPRQRTRLVYEDMSKRRYNPDAADNPVLEVKPKKRKKLDSRKVESSSSDLGKQQESSEPDLHEHDAERESSSDHSEQDSEGDSSSSHDERDTEGDSCSEDSEHSDDGNSGSEHIEHEAEGDSGSEQTEQDIEGDSFSEDSEHSDDGNSGSDHTEHDGEGDSGSEQREQGTEADSSSKTVSAVTGDSLKDLFGGGSSFTFFGAPDAEDADETEQVSFSKQVDVEEEDMEDEEEMSMSNESRVPEIDRIRPPVQQQPSFMVARDDPRLAAAVKFFKRPHPEEFEELSERWTEERQKIMQLVRERHKRACRKERQMKQGVKSRPFMKTKARTFVKRKK